MSHCTAIPLVGQLRGKVGAATVRKSGLIQLRASGAPRGATLARNSWRALVAEVAHSSQGWRDYCAQHTSGRSTTALLAQEASWLAAMCETEDQIEERTGHVIVPCGAGSGRGGRHIDSGCQEWYLNLTYLTMMHFMRLEGTVGLTNHGPVYLAWLHIEIFRATGHDGDCTPRPDTLGVQWRELTDVWQGEVWECADTMLDKFAPADGRIATIWTVTTADNDRGIDVVVSSGASGYWWS